MQTRKFPNPRITRCWFATSYRDCKYNTWRGSVSQASLRASKLEQHDASSLIYVGEWNFDSLDTGKMFPGTLRKTRVLRNLSFDRVRRY
jgi:hypothetical protein